MAASRGLDLQLLLCIAAVLLAAILPATVSADDTKLRDCYYFNGAISPNNTKCPNSNTCCGPRSTCLSNRLCYNPGDGPNVWVRHSCAVKGWDPDCAQICKYDETKGAFPRVTACSDGMLCCSNDPQCCYKRTGIFLDENGDPVSTKTTVTVTSYPVVSGGGRERYTQTPSASGSSTSEPPPSTTDPAETNTSSSNTAASAASTDSEDSDDSGDSSLGLKVGLGLGIPLAVLVTACVVYLLVRRRNRRANEAAVAAPAPSEYSPGPQGPATAQYPAPSQQPLPQYPASIAPPSSYDALSPRTVRDMYSGAPKPPAYRPYNPGPVEIMEHSVTELDGTQYGSRPRHELI